MFACQICGNEFPMKHKRIQSGLRVGVKCCWEPNGGTIERDLRRAAAQRLAAALAAKDAVPPSRDGDYVYGIAPVADLTGLVSMDPFPVVLTRGGVAVAVALTGVGFVAGDTLVYGSGDITDATSPVLVSSISRTLSVEAALAMNAGRYSLTFNDTKWNYVFDVR